MELWSRKWSGISLPVGMINWNMARCWRKERRHGGGGGIWVKQPPFLPPPSFASGHLNGTGAYVRQDVNFLCVHLLLLLSLKRLLWNLSLLLQILPTVVARGWGGGSNWNKGEGNWRLEEKKKEWVRKNRKNRRLRNKGWWWKKMIEDRTNEERDMKDKQHTMREWEGKKGEAMKENKEKKIWEKV